MERSEPLLLKPEDISRVIEMAWEDRTPFEAIEAQFGLSEARVIRLMRATLKAASFRLWRARVHGRASKHRKIRSPAIDRHRASHRI